MRGFVSVHRKMMDNPVWDDPHYLKLWMYCLFTASHKEHEQLVGNNIVKLERGQFVTGRFSLAEDLNKGMKPKQRLAEKTWWRYLLNLERFQMLTIKKTNKYSVVTIDKYDFYQTPGNDFDQQTDHQLTNSCPSVDHQLTTNNNGNNGNNDNNGNKKPSSHKYEICDMENAKLLFELMEGNNPNVKEPNFEKWANDFRLMRERDERTLEQIQYLIRWTQNDEFWSSNILSPSKLRKQWDQLVLKAKQEHERKQGPKVGIGTHQKQNENPYGDEQYNGLF